jgi:hypothetical protein
LKQFVDCVESKIQLHCCFVRNDDIALLISSAA